MAGKLALHGGTPVRSALLPYGRQQIDEADVEAVVDALRSPYITTGPRVTAFEEAFCRYTGAAEAVAVSNGTAALHCAMAALGVGPGDEVIVPPMTFAASANCAVFQGATPVFADVDPGTLLLDPSRAAERITDRTRAIVAVDYAGQPCDYDALRALSEAHGLAIVADACHAVGGAWKGRSVGTLGDLTAFSFHPVKHLTTGEGGLVTTDDPERAAAMRRFRSHGIASSYREREEKGSWHYEMVELGYNYRLTDLQCALGLSQLDRLPGWVDRRRAIADRYAAGFEEMEGVAPLARHPDAAHAWHLYVVRFDRDRFDRGEVFQALRAENIGVNVHYVPVHLHPFYRERFGTGPGLCPVAEQAYEEIVSLPMFAGMTDPDVDDVLEAVAKVADGLAR